MLEDRLERPLLDAVLARRLGDLARVELDVVRRVGQRVGIDDAREVGLAVNFTT